jgi:hypothetical protein
MKIASSLAGLALIAAGSACAGDTGIINQAGTYEQTLKFYLHPAHLFVIQQPALGQHPAVVVKQRANQEAARAMPAVRVHPALMARPAHRWVVAQED